VLLLLLLLNAQASLQQVDAAAVGYLRQAQRLLRLLQPIINQPPAAAAAAAANEHRPPCSR
jgi:hypothetical protein